MTINFRLDNIIKIIYKTDANEFLNCKAEIKYLTAGICESCLLTSGVECYREVIDNGVNGFVLSDNIEEWISLIKKLYNDRESLNKVIRNAYEDVKYKYNINTISENIYNNLVEICKNR